MPRFPKLIVPLFFILYFAGGLFVFRDYGVSYDEKCQRYTGGVSAKYLVDVFYPSYLTAHPELNSITPLHEYIDRDYGVAFELPMAIAEKALGLKEDTAGLYYMRHFANFLFFFIAVFVFYRMVRRRLQSEAWGLLGAAMLCLFPRFFAESFYNSKDIVFLSAFIIGMAALQVFLEKKNWKSAVILGFAGAFAMDVRILGVLLPLAGAGAFLWDMFVTRMDGPEESSAGKKWMTLAVLLVSFSAFAVLLWPFLWTDPVGNFLFAFKNMSSYRWPGSVIFAGQFYSARELPFYYAPVWMLITLPPLYTIGFIAGLVTIVVSVFKNKLKLYSTPGGRFDLVSLALFAAPVLAAILLHSVLYNGWRQLYFTAAPLLLISLSGLHAAWTRWKNSLLSRVIPGLAVLQVLICLIHIVRLHPFQNVYFNVLAGSNADKRFDMDYWGLSYREALEYIATSDPSASIDVNVESYSGELNMAMLPGSGKDRIHVHVNAPSDSLSPVHYHIGSSVLEGRGTLSGYDLVYEVKAGNLVLNQVYKMNGSPAVP